MSQESKKTCLCGQPGCWDLGDHAWSATASGWTGDINGCRSSVFFIHGRRIREQRHIPEGDYVVADLPRLLVRWSEGLPYARLRWMSDTGGGDAGLWIEGEREPTDADWQRLNEYRAHEEQQARREYARLRHRFDPKPSQHTTPPTIGPDGAKL